MEMNSNIEKMLDKYNIQTYNGCVEPGYEDKPVALANWNNIPQKVYNALEFMGDIVTGKQIGRASCRERV